MLTYDVTCPKFLDLCHSNQFSVLVNKIKSLPERERSRLGGKGRPGKKRRHLSYNVIETYVYKDIINL